MNPPFKTVQMFGPSLSDPSKMVNAEIPEADVQAYKAAGYQLGSLDVHEPVVYSEADAAEQAEVELEVSEKVVAKTKAKGKK